MTIEQSLMKMLVDHGMFDQQAQAVIELVKAAKENEVMLGRWGDRVDDYPESVLMLAWASARRIALSWIDENAPQAWFRPMFTNEEVT